MLIERSSVCRVGQLYLYLDCTVFQSCVHPSLMLCVQTCIEDHEQLSVCLIKHHDMKTHGGLEV